MAARAGMRYDAPAAYARLIGPRYRPIAEVLVDDARLRPADDVLELGAGTGLVTRLVAPHVRSLLATDLAPAMLDIARRSVRGHGHVGFAMVDYGRPLPFLDRSFDVVLSGLTYVQTDKAALKEVVRVLKPRGRFALSMWGPKYHELTLLSDALEAIGRPRIPPPSPARAVRALERAGFRAVVRRDFDLTNSFANVDAYIEYRRGFGQPVGASRAFYERYIASVRRRAEQDVDAKGRFTLGWTLSVITARR